RLLHGFEDTRTAGELVLGDAVDAADHLAQYDECRRGEPENDRRHNRILIDHHRYKEYQRKQIAAECRKKQIEYLACSIGAGRGARQELCRVAVGKEREVLTNDASEHLAL